MTSKLPTFSWKWLSPNRLAYLLISIWALAGGVVTAAELRFAQVLERQIQAVFFEIRGPIQPPDNIVILTIDEESLSQAQQYGADPEKYPYLEPLQSWPWKRSGYATVIDRLMKAGAKTVSLDLIFSDPSSYGAEDDEALRQIIQRYPGRVTLAASYESSVTPEGALNQLVAPNPVIYQDDAGQGATPSIGFVNYLPDANGRIYLLGSQYQERIIRPLGLNDLPSFDEATLQAAGISYPKPKGEEIFFYGPRYTFPTVPFFHILEPKNWNGYLKQGQYFKDKIVLIGPTATSLQDLHPTPFSGNWRYPFLMPGVEIHANAIATLMQNRAISSTLLTSPQRGLLVLLGVMLVGWGISSLSDRPVSRAMWSLAIAFGWAAIGYFSLIQAGFIIPTAVPVLLIALSGLSSLGTGTLSEQFEKLRLRRTLERYVAAPVVREILSQPEDFQALLQGRRLKAAVMFCDIRGFTNLSLKVPPEQLVAQLNAYLNVMVQAIITARGTVDKFIGDAVMAEFGSPVSQGEKNDVLNAVKAALSMRKALADLRQQWKKQNQPLLFNGIGINFGEVIAGNVGSVQRLEYTVIGDTVNIASRVEGLTKQFITDILITDSVYDLVQNEIEAIFLGEHPLRGRDGMVGLYSLVGLKGEDSTLYYQVQHDLKKAQEERQREDG
jgi:adenylate cyclase